MSLKITLQKGIQIWKYYGHSLMIVPASVFFIYLIVMSYHVLHTVFSLTFKTVSIKKIRNYKDMYKLYLL